MLTIYFIVSIFSVSTSIYFAFVGVITNKFLNTNTGNVLLVKTPTTVSKLLSPNQIIKFLFIAIDRVAFVGVFTNYSPDKNTENIVVGENTNNGEQVSLFRSIS